MSRALSYGTREEQSWGVSQICLDTFVEDFILGLDDQDWLAMKSELGEEKAREKIRAGIVKMDERNLTNITPKGPIN